MQDLVDIVESKQGLNRSFTMKVENLDTSASLPVCQGCKMTGHLLCDCPKFPFCSSCGVYGHKQGVGCRGNNAAGIFAVEEKRCGYCGRTGHAVEVCFDRMATLFCATCGIAGHIATKFCAQNSRQGVAIGARPDGSRAQEYQAFNNRLGENSHHGNDYGRGLLLDQKAS